VFITTGAIKIIEISIRVNVEGIANRWVLPVLEIRPARLGYAISICTTEFNAVIHCRWRGNCTSEKDSREESCHVQISYRVDFVINSRTKS
jgi:hypothetical protein